MLSPDETVVIAFVVVGAIALGWFVKILVDRSFRAGRLEGCRYQRKLTAETYMRLRSEGWDANEQSWIACADGDLPMIAGNGLHYSVSLDLTIDDEWDGDDSINAAKPE